MTDVIIYRADTPEAGQPLELGKRAILETDGSVLMDYHPKVRGRHAAEMVGRGRDSRRRDWTVNLWSDESPVDVLLDGKKYVLVHLEGSVRASGSSKEIG